MKLNGWSVVKTPLGVSLRPIDGHGEICVSELNGMYRINVYDDIQEEVSLTQIPVKLVTKTN
jgi:hypothetical protein